MLALAFKYQRARANCNGGTRVVYAFSAIATSQRTCIVAAPALHRAELMHHALKNPAAPDMTSSWCIWSEALKYKSSACSCASQASASSPVPSPRSSFSMRRR